MPPRVPGYRAVRDAVGVVLEGAGLTRDQMVLRFGMSRPRVMQVLKSLRRVGSVGSTRNGDGEKVYRFTPGRPETPCR